MHNWLFILPWVINLTYTIITSWTQLVIITLPQYINAYTIMDDIIDAENASWKLTWYKVATGIGGILYSLSKLEHDLSPSLYPCSYSLCVFIHLCIAGLCWLGFRCVMNFTSTISTILAWISWSSDHLIIWGDSFFITGSSSFAGWHGNQVRYQIFSRIY